MTTGSPPPNFIMHDVKLLFKELTAPEDQLGFQQPTRADTSTIQSTVNPPAVSWTWPDAASRVSQQVAAIDISKFGYEVDANCLYQLIAIVPAVVWEPIHIGPVSTWTWQNQVARQNQAVQPSDLGKVGLQLDINSLFRLVNAQPPIWQPIANPNNTSSPLELSTGAADADSFHDFFRLQIAFEDVWVELFDANVKKLAEQLYAKWDAIMSTYDDTGEAENADRKTQFSEPPNPPVIGGAQELQDFIDNLKIVLGLVIQHPGGASVTTQLEVKDVLTKSISAMKMLFDQLYRVGAYQYNKLGEHVWDKNWLSNTSSTPKLSSQDQTDLSAFPGLQRQQIFDWLIQQLSGASAGEITPLSDLPQFLQALDQALSEAVRFDVFAPASINFGVLLNYQQQWHPQSYQVGNLVSTIPLAPQEVRRYTTKQVVKRTRNVKEINDALRSGKDESAETSRVDSEIVDKAKYQTSFQQTASGSFGNDALYKVSAGMQQANDQAVESAQTKHDFHEAVVKSSQEYRNQHRLEIETQQSSEDETTSSQEIRNPNDELTVTYLFYELQRRYLVSEALYKVLPVVMVANDVPAPHEIDAAWILRHDWILRRTILDDSFIPAIDYLATNYAGEEVTLQVLELSVQQQKVVVDNISQQVSLAQASLNTATLGLTNAENTDVADLQQAEQLAVVKSIFDPLGIAGKSNGDGNSDRARVDFAKDALNRAQTKVDQVTADLKSETTALQIAIDKYTAAATKHFSMLADIERLRIHIKDNIIYYMQAIWTYEPTDQRYFRIYNYEVPTFDQDSVSNVSGGQMLGKLDQKRTNFSIVLPPPKLSPETRRLHQVADIDNLLGFKGNYMIFPLVEFDYLTWYQLQNYLHVDELNGVTASDPDPGADYTLTELQNALANIKDQDVASFEENRPEFEEIMARLLSKQDPELVVVPSSSLYIEALPGTHPLLEDFKLLHRKIDVKRAQADARKAELENLRLAARIAAGTLGDPDVDKVVVVGAGQNVTVDAGQ
jgi:hypothetical protein